MKFLNLVGYYELLKVVELKSVVYTFQRPHTIIALEALGIKNVQRTPLGRSNSYTVLSIMSGLHCLSAFPCFLKIPTNTSLSNLTSILLFKQSQNSFFIGSIAVFTMAHSLVIMHTYQEDKVHYGNQTITVQIDTSSNHNWAPNGIISYYFHLKHFVKEFCYLSYGNWLSVILLKCWWQILMINWIIR